MDTEARESKNNMTDNPAGFHAAVGTHPWFAVLRVLFVV